MFQIVFTPASAAEMAALPKGLQLEILSEFHVLTPDFLKTHPEKFGEVRSGDRLLFRYRAKDYRIYFEKTAEGIRIHRVLHKNTLKDFFFRSQIPLTEDEELQKNPQFWEWIDSPDPKNKK
jgi:mRNA-degrading endonuclease RelE of RelBE toxin-antitoxin system